MANNVFECPTCHVVFTSGVALNSHKLTCVMEEPITLSFYGVWKGAGGASEESTAAEKRIEEEEIEKIEPLSQPLLPLAEKENTDHVCDICHKSLPTTRGLKSHRTACLKKQRSAPPVLSATTQQIEQCSQQHSSADVDQIVAGNEINTSLTPPQPIVRDPESPNGGNPPISQDPTLNSQAYVWGTHSGDEIMQLGTSAYEEIVFWRSNIFKLPSGAAGKRYVREMTRLITFWTEDRKPLADVALKLLMVMPALLLQKPHKKSTSKQHTQYLNKRMDLWDAGNLEELLREGRAIQQRLRQNFSKNDTPEHKAKTFAKLMLLGKVNAALKLLDKGSSLGVADVTEETLRDLRKLHPQAEKASEDILISGEIPYFDPIAFHNIDEVSIAKAALRTKGAAGPSGQDAEGWRRILVSKNYGDAGKELRTAIASMTHSLCTKLIPTIPGSNKTNIEAFTSCRLMMLNKAPSGIRPIGIGEVLRRIIGKAVLGEIREDIIESAGSLQVCAGQMAGCEAATHAMGEIFKEEETDAVLFVDASNAFNSLNREAMLHNMQYLCRPLSTYLKNCYGTPSRLFVHNKSGGVELASEEGTTQGDPSAMPAYGIGILPFLGLIKPPNEGRETKHVAYADDLGGGSKLVTLRRWWDRIVQQGPKYGYFPKPEKSWLVVKPEKLAEAQEMFGDAGVKITAEGRKYLGGFVGTNEGRENYARELCKEWIEQLEELSIIARSEPQAAYAGFTAGFKHKLTYFLRTIPNMAEIVKPFDDVLTNKFLPAVTEKSVISDYDRKLFSLPVRLGGLGIPIYSESCSIEFENSQKMSEYLIGKIVTQDSDYVVDPNREREIRGTLKREKIQRQNELLEVLREKMTQQQIRMNDIAQMKGASAWLTSLPLKEEGFVLNKREFFDALAFRYVWPLKRLPKNCACGRTFDMEHALTCMKGGYVHRRHDRIRDLIAHVLKDVSPGVQTEPHLEPLNGEVLPAGSNIDNGARLDIVARDFWQLHEMAFVDIKVFNPIAKSYMRQNLDNVFSQHEKGKKKLYNQRVIQVEHGSFTPIVLSALGGFGLESSRFMANLFEKVSRKKDLEKSVVSNYIRTKISFELVRSQVACVRGARSLKVLVVDTNNAEMVTSTSTIRE